VLDGMALDGAVEEELLGCEELSIEPAIADLRLGASTVVRMVAGDGTVLLVLVAGADALEIVVTGTVGVGTRAALAAFVAGRGTKSVRYERERGTSGASGGAVRFGNELRFGLEGDTLGA
jgi:hypothetical protein